MPDRFEHRGNGVVFLRIEFGRGGISFQITYFSFDRFDPIRQAWLAGAARVGETVTARTGTSATTGTFETVDPSGHLVLSTPSGRIAVAAADVFF